MVSREHFDATVRHLQWMIAANTALVLITLAAVLATLSRRPAPRHPVRGQAPQRLP
jgi:hypothetical protein